MAKREAKTSPRRLEATAKQAVALKLRLQGLDYRTIAGKLGYAGPAGAYGAVAAALDKTLREPSDELRRLELERLDRLQQIAWAFAMGGDGPAIDRCLRIMQRRAALLGLDAAIEYTINDIQSIARKVVNALDSEIEDENMRNRIFLRLGFTDGRVETEDV